jgi:hypothetical protein
MDSRAAIIGTCWIAIAIISAMYIYVGKVNFGTDIIVALLVLIATGVTFGVGFGLEGMQRYGPPSRAEATISFDLTELKTAITELTKKVDALQKELQE